MRGHVIYLSAPVRDQIRGRGNGRGRDHLQQVMGEHQYKTVNIWMSID